MADEKEFGTIVFLEEGVEIADVVRKDGVRVVIYRDKRDDDRHWYEWEMLVCCAWKPMWRVSDKRLQDTIDLLTRAKQAALLAPAQCDE